MLYEVITDALAAFNEALEREPDSILALTSLVNTYIAMGNPDGAIAKLDNVLQKKPQHPAAHDLLGVAYMAKREFGLSEKQFSKQIEFNPKSSVVYTQLAAARARTRPASPSPAASPGGGRPSSPRPG